MLDCYKSLFYLMCALVRYLTGQGITYKCALVPHTTGKERTTVLAAILPAF